jgi:pilus assembly protein CpaF
MTTAPAAARYGFIAELLDDPMIEEIIVIGGERTFIVRNGVKELVNVVVDQHAVRRIADQLLAGTGRRIDQANPIVSAQLPSGSRVHITGPPVTHANRMNIQIRKFVVTASDLADLVERGTMTSEAASFLRSSIEEDATILVAGAPGAGKTTLVNCLLREVPPDRRVVTCEEVFEIDVDLPDLTQMQTREAGLDGGAAIALRDLVREALRQRPDRIVVGEVRGPEAPLHEVHRLRPRNHPRHRLGLCPSLGGHLGPVGHGCREGRILPSSVRVWAAPASLWPSLRVPEGSQWHPSSSS